MKYVDEYYNYGGRMSVFFSILKYFPIFVVIAFALTIFLYWQNYGVRITRYDVFSENLPTNFDGYEILQVSDFHNCEQTKIKIENYAKKLKPDVIAITGDVVDSRRTNFSVAIELGKELSPVAPCLYVPGNHEARLKNYGELKNELEKIGFTVLNNEKIYLERDGEKISVIGLEDPRFYVSNGKDMDRGPHTPQGAEYVKKLFKLSENENLFKIVLAHRPEFLEEYKEAEVDLALTGHNHGGQFSIPFTHIGVYVPNQGFFLRHASGMKTQGKTTEIISRGLGNSSFPIRLFNRPEVVLVTLHKTKI
jgi:predicted MPP superfamily phosphohydrolase